MSTELIPAPANGMAPRGPVGPALITDEHRSILKGMVDRNATPAQVEMLIVVGNRYDLDPLMGHVVLINGKCFVTHKGLMHKAHTSGQFDGIETGYGKDELGEWCECRVWRKDMGRPFVGRIYLNEYRGAGPVWKQYPRAMAAKTAESFVLRRAFDVALTSQEEMGVSDMGAPEAARRPAAEAPEDAAWKAARRAASAAIKALDSEGKAFWSDEIARRFGTADLNAMTRQDLEDVALLIAEAQAVIVRAAEEDPFADDGEGDQPALMDVPPAYDKPGHGDH